MTSDKLASFSLGGTKKTAFEKRKEELAAKRKEQEDALAAEQARFIEEFEGGPDKPKQFVRAGEKVGESDARPLRLSAGPRISAPVRRVPSASVRNAFASLDDDLDGAAVDGEPLKPAPVAPPKKAKDKGPSQMETFMQELRREQVTADKGCRGGLLAAGRRTRGRARARRGRGCPSPAGTENPPPTPHPCVLV